MVTLELLCLGYRSIELKWWGITKIQLQQRQGRVF